MKWMLWMCLWLASETLGQTQPFKVAVMPEAEQIAGDIKPWVTKALAEVGYHPIWIELGASEAQQQLSQGILDADLLRFDLYSQQEDYKIQLPIELVTTKIWLWVTEQSNCPDLNHISHYKPIGIKGVRYFADIYQMTQVGYIEAPSVQQSVVMLNQGQGDYLAAPKEVVTQLVASGAPRLIQCNAFPILEYRGHFYVHKRHRALVNDLNLALRVHQPAK